jgi:uncharacterized membrane protein YqjE
MRSSFAAFSAQAALHGQLARLEWAVETARWARMAVAGLLAFASALCLLLAIGAVALLWFWNTQYRVGGCVAVVLGYAVLLMVCLRSLQNSIREGANSFSATRVEIAADIALLKANL